MTLYELFQVCHSGTDRKKNAVHVQTDTTGRIFPTKFLFFFQHWAVNHLHNLFAHANDRVSGLSLAPLMSCWLMTGAAACCRCYEQLLSHTGCFRVIGAIYYNFLKGRVKQISGNEPDLTEKVSEKRKTIFFPLTYYL